MHERVTFINLYLDDDSSTPTVQLNEVHQWNISVFSSVVIPSGFVGHTIVTTEDQNWAHWTIMDNCEEAHPYIDSHHNQFNIKCPNGSEKLRIESF